ncbi:hypothetical protein G6F22_017267 [Rhizopus arrhizus]|nr:hypothetical protein G6F22_017267 [Rhizopus arrhizus]
MVGAYAALFVVQHFGLPLWGALMGAFFVAGFTGVIIDYLVLKPLRKRNAPHLIPMIATIGVGIILNNGAQSIFGASNLRFPHGTVPEEVIEVAGLHLTVIELGIIFLSFALMAVLMYVMRRTQFGRALRAIAESPKAAWLLGINVERLFVTTSFAAAALGGVAGVLIGLASRSSSWAAWATSAAPCWAGSSWASPRCCRSRTSVPPCAMRWLSACCS